jgi:hypothetical protein
MRSFGARGIGNSLCWSNYPTHAKWAKFANTNVTTPLPRADRVSLTLRGERGPRPRGLLGTCLLSISLVYPALRAGELCARWLIGYKRPLTLELSEAGLSVRQQTVLLGRLLSDSEVWIPRENLAQITREVRYARVGLYAGLLALALGSYAGFRLISIGLSVPGGSLGLLGQGLLVLALGIGVDFLISTARTSARSRCRVVVVPQQGPAFSLLGADRAAADAALSALVQPGASG